MQLGSTKLTIREGLGYESMKPHKTGLESNLRGASHLRQEDGRQEHCNNVIGCCLYSVFILEQQEGSMWMKNQLMWPAVGNKFLPEVLGRKKQEAWHFFWRILHFCVKSKGRCCMAFVYK